MSVINQYMTANNIFKNKDYSAETKLEYQTKSEIAKNKIEDEKLRFLQTFLAQIKNQLPTEPMEQKEMSQLTAAFSQVEQQVEINKNLERLVKAQEKLTLGSPISYLGTKITTDSSYSELKDNRATFSYSLPEECKEVNINVRDIKGKLITTDKGPTDIGYNEFIWNGKNDQGVKYPNGRYQIEIEAYKADKEYIKQKINYCNLANGVADIAYNLPYDFDKAELFIKDTANNVIYQTSLNVKSGNHNFIWEGKDSNGNIIPDGEYNFELKGRKLNKFNLLDSNIVLTDNAEEFKYSISDHIRDAIISIKDDNMREVFNARLDKNIGENSFLWNGKNNLGEDVPKDRKYNISISAIKNPSTNNNKVVANTIFEGLVTGVDNSRAEPTLTVNGKQIALDKVKSVSL